MKLTGGSYDIAFTVDSTILMGPPRVRIALSDLQTGPSLPLQIKVNLVTVDDLQRPLDALGSGATDRFGFVTLDLRRQTYLTMTHLLGNVADPAFGIAGRVNSGHNPRRWRCEG
jgi:hypothetical protein